MHRTVCITNAWRSMQLCVQDRENLFYGRSLGVAGFFIVLCVPAHALLFGRRSPRWHALAHLLGNDREEQFRFLQRFFFEIPEDAYFIRVLNSGHTYCSFLVCILHTLRRYRLNRSDGYPFACPSPILHTDTFVPVSCLFPGIWFL